jgi:hypothetical protein
MPHYESPEKVFEQEQIYNKDSLENLGINEGEVTPYLYHDDWTGNKKTGACRVDIQVQKIKGSNIYICSARTLLWPGAALEDSEARSINKKAVIKHRWDKSDLGATNHLEFKPDSRVTDYSRTASTSVTINLDNSPGEVTFSGSKTANPPGFTIEKITQPSSSVLEWELKFPEDGNRQEDLITFFSRSVVRTDKEHKDNSFIVRVDLEYTVEVIELVNNDVSKTTTWGFNPSWTPITT